jgi:hypothetical protein
MTIPVITLNGDATINLEVGTTYNDLGAVARDYLNSEIQVVVTGTVNTSVIGDYTITYNATDSNNLRAAARTRVISVKDTQSPVITLNGNDNISIQVGQAFTDAGATVSDNYNNNLTAVVTGSVNANIVGTYTLTYNATDSSGNKAITRTRTINVTASSNSNSTVNTAFSFDKTNGTIDGYDASFGTNVVIPSSIDGVAVNTIGYQAFRNKGLTSVTIPNTVTTIRGEAFYTNNLSSVTIPNSVTIISSYAFAYNQINILTIGSGLRDTGSYSFAYNSIDNLVIPNSVEIIQTGSFANNPISQLTLGTGIRQIQTNAFVSETSTASQYRSKITSLTIPSNVTSISSSAFRNVPLTSITIQGTQNRFNSTWTQIGFPGNLKPQQ